MAKLTLLDITAVQNQTSLAATINLNSEAIEDAIENTISRDGTTPNTMGADLDMNSHRIVNLPNGVNDNEAVNLGQVRGYLGGLNPDALQTAIELVQEDREATEEARDIAVAAATAVQTFDPANYYPKTAFKADGTANAPVKYDTGGRLIAKEVVADTAAGANGYVSWKTEGVARWTLRSDASDNLQLRAYDNTGAVVGDVLDVNRSNLVVTFGVVPKITGIAKGDLLVGSGTDTLSILPVGTVGKAPIVQSNGSLAFEAAKWIEIGSNTVSSGTAAVNFTGITGFFEYMVLWDGLTFSDNQEILMRLSADGGSTYISTNYNSYQDYGNGANSSTAALLLGRAGTTGLYSVGVAFIRNMNDASRRTYVEAHSNQVSPMNASGFQHSAAAHNAIMICPNSGTIVGGTIKVYGRN